MAVSVEMEIIRELEEALVKIEQLEENRGGQVHWRELYREAQEIARQALKSKLKTSVPSSGGGDGEAHEVGDAGDQRDRGHE